MSKTLELATPGQWASIGGRIATDSGVVVGVTETRYHAETSDRIAEREANARLMAEARAMYQLILELQYKPMNQVVGEIRRIMHSVDGTIAMPAESEEELAYERT